MSTLQQIRKGIGRAFESIQEGWQQLRERTSHALTHFSLSHSNEDREQQQLEAVSPRWGLLAAEMRESDDEILVRLEIPGMERDQFDISLHDDVLVIRGEKHIQREESRGRYHIMERAYGRFERAIPLTASVDDEAVSAKYRKGVLTIRLPKKERITRRRINVQQA